MGTGLLVAWGGRKMVKRMGVWVLLLWWVYCSKKPPAAFQRFRRVGSSAGADAEESAMVLVLWFRVRGCGVGWV